MVTVYLVANKSFSLHLVNFQICFEPPKALEKSLLIKDLFHYGICKVFYRLLTSLDASFPNQFSGANSCSFCKKHSGLGLICLTGVHIFIVTFDP